MLLPDYQGVVKFEEDEEPTIKELKDVKLGCFDFEVKETGDFEMIVDKNVTVAPLAEVLVSSETGMGGMEKTVETTTVTVTIPYTSYVTTYLTTGAEGQVTTITQTITEYQTRTLTKTRTKWKTTTTTVTTTVKEGYPVYITVTTTKTVTKTVEGRPWGIGPGYSGVILLYYPYSEFIFINE